METEPVVGEQLITREDAAKIADSFWYNSRGDQVPGSGPEDWGYNLAVRQIAAALRGQPKPEDPF
jgi:hypothetical protein